MSDKELLILAAKAADMGCVWSEELQSMHWPKLESMGLWNPLVDDGAALRLAVKLIITVCPGPAAVLSVIYDYGTGEDSPSFEIISSVVYDDEGMDQAVNKCIVRAAAEIGRRMPK